MHRAGFDAANPILVEQATRTAERAYDSAPEERTLAVAAHGRATQQYEGRLPRDGRPAHAALLGEWVPGDG